MSPGSLAPPHIYPTFYPTIYPNGVNGVYVLFYPTFYILRYCDICISRIFSVSAVHLCFWLYLLCPTLCPTMCPNGAHGAHVLLCPTFHILNKYMKYKASYLTLYSCGWSCRSYNKILDLPHFVPHYVPQWGYMGYMFFCTPHLINCDVNADCWWCWHRCLLWTFIDPYWTIRITPYLILYSWENPMLRG